MPSETQEFDMTASAPLMQSTSRHDRDRQPTLTTVSELILVSTVDEAMPVSTPTPHSRVVQRSDDAPNRPQLKHKKRKVEDPYNILVSDEREKIKREVKKFRLEINNVDFHLLFIFKTATVCTICILMLYLLSLFIMFLVCITN